MTPKNETTIKSILTADDKAKFVDWVRDNIGQADKCVVVFGSRNPETHGLNITGQQIGFDYAYELLGFIDVTADTFCNGEDEDDAQ